MLERVRQGVEVIIERDARPIAVLRCTPRKGRLISESIAAANARGAVLKKAKLAKSSQISKPAAIF